jgi:NDP-sugar pyrophosphorylase family protein
MNYKVLLTASGIGSRLGNFTQYTNKSLVAIGNRPAICHIIERYPKDVEFVVTLGYFGTHVKQFLLIAYPERKFTFVQVDNYDGPGSSLGYSQLCAEKDLQCPFIYNACDTIVTETIPPPSVNWVGAKPGDASSQYDSITVDSNNDIRGFHRKGYMEASHIHIGLVGVHDYEQYWKTLRDEYKSAPNNQTLNDVSVLERLTKKSKWKVVEFDNWYDIGNVQALKKARSHWKDSLHVLEKQEESISHVGQKIIKFFYNENIVLKRCQRAKILKGLVPQITDQSANFYAYNFVSGSLAADVMTPEKMKHLLEWASKNLWLPTSHDENFEKQCMHFYQAKTTNRINDFLKGYKPDSEHIINGINVPSLDELMAKVPWDKLKKANPTNFHGDFILDNIIIEHDGSFKLLDWRHQFGFSSITAGDAYYDLAKLNHNLTVNHDIICRDLYKVDVNDNIVTCDILRKNNHVQCADVLKDYVVTNGYDFNIVETITGLIWLSMAPLHHQPFDEFLYYYGKLKLTTALKKWGKL